MTSSGRDPMPIAKVYRHGLTMGTPPTRNDHMRGKRDVVTGWTDRSTRSNTRFLYSVDERKLTGDGFALSLTLRECPPTSDDWHKARRAFLMRLQRMGMIRGHWLTEWQLRGVPHLHAAVWFDEGLRGRDPFALSTIREHWLAGASCYGAGRRAQHVQCISDSVGWFQYLSKHAVRGLKHYQRSSENIPSGWATTGRMWGHVGEWPTVDAIGFRIDHQTAAALRRIIRGWRRADARASGDRYRIRSARVMLKCNQRELSTVRGISEWFPQGLSDLALLNLATRGYNVRC